MPLNIAGDELSSLCDTVDHSRLNCSSDKAFAYRGSPSAAKILARSQSLQICMPLRQACFVRSVASGLENALLKLLPLSVFTRRRSPLSWQQSRWIRSRPDGLLRACRPSPPDYSASYGSHMPAVKKFAIGSSVLPQFVGSALGV
jgi:hypothetical protein